VYFCSNHDIKMVNNISIYDEVASFIASMNLEKVIVFNPSSTNQERLDFLLDRQKESVLAPDENSKIEHYLIINRIVDLAKARTLNLLAA
jgi:stalled ribosome rescue protein Dom34